MGCYRQSLFPDAEMAARAFVSVLVRYPESIVIAVTEPATGIPSKLKWPPSIAEVVEACDKVMEPILRDYERKMVDHRHREALPPPPAGPKMTMEEMETKLGRPLFRTRSMNQRFKSIDEAAAAAARIKAAPAPEGDMPEPPEAA